jgi:maltose alpha-D-glucosyltransferase/alpha-amylase
MDPVYGYEAINVEAQQSDSSSLLHWMRNMIALRKLFRVFGRGSLEFLEPDNRKVLAYLRKYGEDQILCVANLSRFGQPVELELAPMAGMTPVEMLGYTEFPTIGKEPYRLTLGPYAFFWFELQGIPEPIEVRTTMINTADPCPITLQQEKDLLEPRGRTLVETALIRFLPRQRWFGAKTRTIEKTRIADWAWIPSASDQFAFVLVEVHYSDGGMEMYNVPLAMATGAAAESAMAARPESVICDARIGDENGILYEATADDAACQALLDAVENSREFSSKGGVVTASPTHAYTEARGSGPLKVSRSGVEQSNTSVIFGGRLIMKLFRRAERGPNPDFEIGRFLTEEARFPNIPALAGGIEYGKDGERSTLAMLQRMVPNQGDGWKMTMEELARYFEHSATFRSSAGEIEANGSSLIELSQKDIPLSAREKIGIYVDIASTLGRRTAQMHMALATSTEDPAFTPQPLSKSDIAKLAVDLRDHASAAFDSLKASLPALPDEFVDRAGLALGQRRRLLDRFRALEQMDANVAAIRVHGDYHLGQVLWVENDFVILDFEGEPARPLAERRMKQLALKDVAGMLRSLSYAAYASLLTYAARRLEDYDRLEPWATFWERWTSAAFLHSYRQTAAGAIFLPGSNEQFEALLDTFLLDKALYELNYELNNRPTWVRIPLHGILSLAR